MLHIIAYSIEMLEIVCRDGGYSYRVYANKMHDPIIARRYLHLRLFIMYLKIASDYLYQKTAPKFKLLLIFLAIRMHVHVHASS